jgi:putative flippase GtrA
MTLASSRVVTAAKRRFKTTAGKRFSRFVGVAVASLAASQLALLLLVSGAHLSPGVAGVLAAAFGAAVSYVLSRWAWERKGRPHLLKETLPFWLVSAGAWLVLGLASHFSSVLANDMGLHNWERQAVINIGYLLANCVTFVTRFLIFHYVLFADRGSKPSAPAPSAEDFVRASAPDGIASAPFPANGSNGSGVRVNGSSAWAAERSPTRREAEEAAVPEPGARR